LHHQTPQLSKVNSTFEHTHAQYKESTLMLNKICCG